MAKKPGTRPEGTKRDAQLREQIACEAARLLSQADEKTYQAAKLKAAQRLGISEKRALPTSEEIEAALVAYQNLFGGTAQQEVLQKLRHKALVAMKLLEAFSPRLVGAVLAGTANEWSNINLHVFTDLAEEINWCLLENQIPFDESDRVYFISPKHSARSPVVSFVAGETVIEISIFPADGIRQAVRASETGRAIERASYAKVETLLNNA